MRVCYLPVVPTLASARLRGYIPGRELARMGFDVTVDYTQPCDWVVLVKHKTGEEFRKNARHVLYDICDDHFHGEVEAETREGCRVADVITCNSESMKAIVKRETGRDAIVIDDPYESPECAPKCGQPVLWFGSKFNLHTLKPWVEKLPPLVIVTDAPGFVPWSLEVMEEAWKDCGMVVIPTDPAKPGKSANRAVESIRRGLFPVCGRLPAYEQLGLGVDDIAGEVANRLRHPKDTKDMVTALQGVVRERFSPRAVAEKWAQCFV